NGGDALAAVDVHRLDCRAQGELGSAFEDVAAALPFAGDADLAAVEAIVRVEVIEDKDAVAGEGDGRAAADSRNVAGDRDVLFHAQRVSQVEITEADQAGEATVAGVRE